MLKAKQLNILIYYTQVAKIRKNISHGIAGPRGKERWATPLKFTRGGVSGWGRKAEAKRELLQGSVFPLRFESRNRQLTICSRGVLNQLG